MADVGSSDQESARESEHESSSSDSETEEVILYC